MKSPIILLSYLFTDVKRMMPFVKGLDRDFLTIKNRFEHEGISFLAVTLSTLSEAVDSGLQTGSLICPTSFKKKAALPLLLRGLLIRVFDESGQLRHSPCIESILTIRQICRMYKKTTVTSSRNDKLHADAVSSFVETDISLVEHKFDPQVLKSLQLVAYKVNKRLDFYSSSDIDSYRHGPGGVFEKVAGNSKWVYLYNQLESDSYISEHIGLSDQVHYGLEEDDEYAQRLSYGGKGRLISVPKTATAVRTITVEPLLNQFIQQGLNNALRDSIVKCNVLSRCLTLTDQSINQRLALIGSHTGEWTTIDLRSASDLVSIKLVKTCFSHHQRFYESLMSSRSNCLDVDSRLMSLHKYAGMGNATTFPIQSVCFALICIAAMLEQDGSKPTQRNVEQAAMNIHVFGDDIIIKTEYFQTVSRWLCSLALRVNEKKTFSNGKFRESCGTDAYDGVDITPTYVRFCPSKLDKKANNIASSVSLSNQLWLKGYHSTSDAIRKHVEKVLKRTLPHVNANSGLLGWSDRYGATSANNWSKDLHCLLIEGPMVISKSKKSPLSGRPALLKYFLTSLIERRPRHLDSSTMRFNTRIVSRRVPAKAGF